MAAPKNRPRSILLSPEFQLICAMSMMVMVAGALVAPVVPDIAKEFDIGPGSVGLINTTFTLPGIFSIPVTGVLADRFGRKPVIIPLLFLYGIAGTACAFAPNFETFLVLRFFAGIGAGSMAGLIVALIGDNIAAEQRTAAFGLRMAVAQSGNMMLPLLAGALAYFGWQYPFLLFSLAIPIGLASLFVLENKKPAKKMSITEYFKKVARGTSNPKVAVLFIVVLTVTMINHGINHTYLPVFLEDRFAATAFVIALVLTGRTLAAAFSGVIVGRLTTRFREEWIVILAFVLLGLGMFMIPFAHSPWWVVLSTSLTGLGTGMGVPAYQSILIRQAPPDAVGGVTAANSMMGRFGQTVGPIFAGMLYGLGGFPAIFFGAALFVAAGLAVLVTRARTLNIRQLPLQEPAE